MPEIFEKVWQESEQLQTKAVIAASRSTVDRCFGGTIAP